MSCSRSLFEGQDLAVTLLRLVGDVHSLLRAIEVEKVAANDRDPVASRVYCRILPVDCNKR